MTNCSLTLSGNNLVVKTPYDAGFVQALKALIPATQRKFDPGAKAWLVDPSQGKTAADLIGQYFGEMVLIPSQIQIKPQTRTDILDVRYIGACKDRGSERSAFGFMAGEWSVIFPEDVLKSWFMDTSNHQIGVTTLYSLLGLSRDADPDQIKSGYRRMARQWHPDVCKEPDAAERFQKISGAYEILKDQNKRARYDAGLVFEASLGRSFDPVSNDLYRAPLRCGLILATGQDVLDRFVVEKILAWEDITNSQGQTLVSSWLMGDTKPREVWA